MSYLVLVTSLPLLAFTGWLFDDHLYVLFVISSLATTILLSFILFKTGSENVWANYISELTASVITLSITISIIFPVTGSTPLGFSSAGKVPLEHTDILFLIAFLSLGIFLTNVRTFYPTGKSIIHFSVSFFRSAFIPPYEEEDVEIQHLERPTIGPDISYRKPLYVGFLSGFGCFSLLYLPMTMGDFEDMIEGHFHILWYIQNLLTGDLEKILNGSIGIVDEVVNILDPLVFILYISILLLSFSYATNIIYFIRVSQERVRLHFGLSPMNMSILMLLICIPLSIFCQMVADYIILMSNSIGTFILAET